VTRRKIKNNPNGTEVVNVSWVVVMRHRMKCLIREKLDYEQAHGGEDMIYLTVLEEIAKNKDLDISKVRALAKAAIRTQEIHFPRTCGPWSL